MIMFTDTDYHGKRRIESYYMNMSNTIIISNEITLLLQYAARGGEKVEENILVMQKHIQKHNHNKKKSNEV